MKKVEPTWIHLLGTLIFFGVLLLIATQVVIPRLYNKIQIDQFSYLPKPSEDNIKPGQDYIANITTSEGSFTVDLFEASAPKNVNNFVYLSNKGYYKGVYFHRLIPNLLIQGGDRNTLNSDPTDDGYGKTSYYIDDELNWQSLGLSQDRINQLESQGYVNTANLTSHPLEKYSLAMANNGPNTNSSQFFIVLAEDSDSRLKELNGQFTVIGKVISGQEVVDAIGKIPVDDPTSNTARPIKKIQITDIKILTK